MTGASWRSSFPVLGIASQTGCPAAGIASAEGLHRPQAPQHRRRGMRLLGKALSLLGWVFIALSPINAAVTADFVLMARQQQSQWLGGVTARSPVLWAAESVVVQFLHTAAYGVLLLAVGAVVAWIADVEGRVVASPSSSSSPPAQD